MESSTGPLQPTRRAPPPPRLSSSSRSAVAATAPKSTARRAAGTPPPTPASSTPVPAPRTKLSQSLSMPFVRRQTQNHVNGRKKAPPPRPPPPKVSLPGNRLKNSVPDNIGGKDNDAVLIDLSPTPSSSTNSLNVNSRNSDQQQFSLLDAPISSYEPVVSSNHGTNGHINPDPFGSIEEDNLTPNTFSLNQGMNCGSNGRVLSTVEFPSHTSYNSLDLDSGVSTTIDWSSAKRASVGTSSDAISHQKSQFYTDATRGTTKKKPTIIKPKNVTVSCVVPNQAKDHDIDLGGTSSRPHHSVQKSLASYAIAEFDYQSSEAGDLCFQAKVNGRRVIEMNGINDEDERNRVNEKMNGPWIKVGGRNINEMEVMKDEHDRKRKMQGRVRPVTRICGDSMVKNVGSFLDMDGLIRAGCFSGDGVHLSQEGETKFSQRFTRWISAIHLLMEGRMD
ncbi:hypothetical protein FHG87_012594 [Trinorchestia longiramus]|nr:hypothetical protein FHG87_012594 [Trinorchestia longiramus]